MVLRQIGVLIGALISNTTVAWFFTPLPLASPFLGLTENTTLPVPAGATPVLLAGRKPAHGSSGGAPVEASIELKVHLSRPLVESRLPWILTLRSATLTAPMSTVVLWLFDPGGGVTTVLPKPIGPSCTVLKLNFFGSSWSVITTCCAGAF